MKTYGSKQTKSNDASVFCRNVCHLFRSGRSACLRDCADCCRGKKRASSVNVKGKKSCGCGR